MIEKPVASIKIFFDSTTIQSELGLLDLPDGTLLFTESQLKAERERAIRECAEICSHLTHNIGLEAKEAAFTNACESEILKLLDN
jgi:hypothetical protein